MCGILGFVDKESVSKELVKKCIERGGRSTIIWAPIHYFVFNEEDDQLINTMYILSMGLTFSRGPALIHSRAPTQRTGKVDCPYMVGDWITATNGVIHNKDIIPPNYPDTWLISKYLAEDRLRELEGTFATWAHHELERQTYLFRWVNPIYANEKIFSSVPFEGGSLIEEGKVYTWPQMQIVKKFQPQYHPYKNLTTLS